MTQSSNPLVAAADYADSLIAARRGKTTLCMLLFFVIGAELTIFFMLRYMPSLAMITNGLPVADTYTLWDRSVFQYVIGLLDFAGLVLSAVLAVLVLVILQVQVVARVAGTGRVTSALIWGVLLSVFLFPWQAVLNNPAIRADAVSSAIGLKVPGVIYTWAEVSHADLGARFPEFNHVPKDQYLLTGLHWVRYVGFPLLAMLLIGLVHTKTERGLRQSFGTDVVVLPPTTGTTGVTTLDPGDVIVTDVDPRL